MKGQSAIEFIILVGAAVALVTTFIALLSSNYLDKQNDQRSELVRDTAAQIQEEIRLASGASDGYQRTLVLPETLLGRNYSVQIVDNLLYVKTLDNKDALALEISNVTGTIMPGTNILRKINGSVYANS